MFSTLFLLGATAYLGYFLHRRSRKLAAGLFEIYTGPDRDWSNQDRTDWGSVGLAVSVIGMAIYFVVQYW